MCRILHKYFYYEKTQTTKVSPRITYNSSCVGVGANGLWLMWIPLIFFGVVKSCNGKPNGLWLIAVPALTPGAVTTFGAGSTLNGLFTGVVDCKVMIGKF